MKGALEESIIQDFAFSTPDEYQDLGVPSGANLFFFPQGLSITYFIRSKFLNLTEPRFSV